MIQELIYYGHITLVLNSVPTYIHIHCDKKISILYLDKVCFVGRILYLYYTQKFRQNKAYYKSGCTWNIDPRVVSGRPPIEISWVVPFENRKLTYVVLTKYVGGPITILKMLKKMSVQMTFCKIFHKKYLYFPRYLHIHIFI